MHKAKKGKKIWIIVIAAAILVAMIAGLVSCLGTISGSINMSDLGMETLTAERQDLYEDISVSGNVESESIIKVTSMLSAKVEQLYVEIGSPVKEGDVLCIFDSSDLQAEYDSLLASMEKANAQTENTHKINLRNLEDAKTERDIMLNQAQQTVNDATAARDRAYEKYYAYVDSCSALSAQRDDLANRMNAETDPALQAALAEQYAAKAAELQAAENMRDSLNEQLPSYENAIRSAQDAYNSTQRSADAAVQSCQDVLDAEQFSMNGDTQKQLDKIQSQIDACTVKAPASGIITSLNIAQGSIPTTDALMTIEDAERLKISVKINETDILKIQPGMKAIIKTNATGDAEFSGQVSRVVNIFSGNAESGGGYSAEISIDGSGTELLIGMNAKVKIVLAERTDVLAVPYESITENEQGDTIVYVVQTDEAGNRTAHGVPVTVGMESSYYVEITGGELEEGDTIVMTAAGVSEGDVIPPSGFEEGDQNA